MKRIAITLVLALAVVTAAAAQAPKLSRQAPPLATAGVAVPNTFTPLKARSAPLTVQNRAAIAQQLTGNTATAPVGAVIHLDPQTPFKDGASLAFFAFNSVQAAGNYGSMVDGATLHVNWPATWPPGLRLIDCAFQTPPPTMDYVLYGSSIVKGTAPTVNEHMVFVVQGDAKLTYAEIRSKTYNLAFWYCEITRLS